MMIRFQKKSIYLLMCIAAVFVSIVLYHVLNPLETSTPPVKTEAQLNEARGHTPEELGRYIDRVVGNSYRIGNSYAQAQKYLTQADVPGLLTMLSEPQECQTWNNVTELLGYIDKEEESVDAFIAFIYRKEDWEGLRLQRPEGAMRSKVFAISKLGFIGGDTVTDALRELLTEEGANKFLSAWGHDAIEATSISTSFIQGRAARGLVHTQETENIQLVEEQYQTSLQQMRTVYHRIGELSWKQMTEEERLQKNLYYQMIEALAARDYIASEGMEAWIRARNFAQFNHGNLSLDYLKYRKALEE